MKNDDAKRLLVKERDKYLHEMQTEARSKGVKITAWEVEEIEMAFERAFTLGYCAGTADPEEIGSFN